MPDPTLADFLWYARGQSGTFGDGLDALSEGRGVSRKMGRAMRVGMIQSRPAAPQPEPERPQPPLAIGAQSTVVAQPQQPEPQAARPLPPKPPNVVTVPKNMRVDDTYLQRTARSTY